jgi:rod shape-determining protein MreD
MSIEFYIRAGLSAIFLLLVQTVFIPLISVGGYTPDLLLLWVVIVSLSRGQMEGTVAGFTVGLLQDLIAVKFLGLAALSKTLTGFILGYFYNENTTEQTLGSYRLLSLVVLGALIHSLIYFLILLQGVDGMLLSFLELTVGTTLYTGVFGFFPMFLFSRKYHVQWSR